MRRTSGGRAADDGKRRRLTNESVHVYANDQRLLTCSVLLRLGFCSQGCPKSRTSDANDLCEAFVRGVTYGYQPRLRWSLNTPIHAN